jgi:ABC-2 type transport system permease protein
LYFLNIRRFRYDDDPLGAWSHMISELNLAVVGLILSTFTTRFIFPMISLEGRRFWILGLLPVDRAHILRGKLLFAATGSTLIGCSLVAISDAMLRVDWAVRAAHQVSCVALCLGLSGIAVGLGARMPNMRETSPAKIAAGFGGTLNLMLSALYVAMVIPLTAIPAHGYISAMKSGVLTIEESPQRMLNWLIAGAVANVLLCVMATIVPMRIGLRAFRRMEF